ncbi:PilW family protein [Psychromonas algarum]|uniref:PilW family protein n=1 Tax=Psychromonas algarum TaxID=2555643 RepID=UPI00141A123D|nr:PilW family protein [Psychromonas sp. RZ22]
MDPLKKSNKGFSLIELMIAMVVSLLIISGLFYSVMGDMKSYESARGTQGLVSKSRMTVQTLRLYIQQAGFRDVNAIKFNSLYDSGTSPAGWVWGTGQVLQGAVSSTTLADEKADSDIIALRFSGADQSGIVDCSGNNLNSTTVHEVTIYVNVNNQLMCRDNAGAALLLDENVEFLELLYGTSDNPTRYFTAANVDDWDTVNRVKIGFLLSQEVNGNKLINNNTYTLFNHTVSAANDTNLRAVVMETVLIGNQGG